MTKVRIEPGICGFTAIAEAEAAEHFPFHAACPVIAGITKCAEAECALALRQDAGIFFEE